MTHYELTPKPEAFSHFEDIKIIDGLNYYCIDRIADIESHNPFIVNSYDFQTGFYKGDFEFVNPLTAEVCVDTPEAFGRYRIAQNLIAQVAEVDQASVADIGSGTLDIARVLPLANRANLTMYNCDISGPWTDPNGDSALERGAYALLRESEGDHGFTRLENVQYDFNRSSWPFAPETLDAVVSNMALHHIATDNKATVIGCIYDSLKPGGTLILNDVYQRREDRPMLTRNGARGPSECKGYPIAFAEAFELFEQAGFIFDEVAQRAKTNETDVLDSDIAAGLAEPSRSLPISNSVWFTVLHKPEQRS